MNLKISISRVQENKEKKQLRFSFLITINSIPIYLITGMRIKNNKLYFPSYLNGGQHRALIFSYPQVLDKLKQMLETEVGWHYSDYAAEVDVTHCAPSAEEQAKLLGDKPLEREFDV